MAPKEARLIIFDLDFTLWDCGGTWCDCTRPPYSSHDGRVRDSAGNEIILYPHIREILSLCSQRGISLALASRTDRPAWAGELLRRLEIDFFFAWKEIYPGSKVNHLSRIRDASAIPYEETLFFDDEERNIRETSSLGVNAVFVPRGLDWSLFSKASGIIRG